MTPLTIRLDEDLERALDAYCRRSGQKRSAVVRDALRRKLAVERFEQLRAEAIPYAEAQGYFTDEDVFRDIS
jgi:predicted transcriptional regulator